MMRRFEPWLIAISLAVGAVAGTTSVSAQPGVRDHRGPNPPPPVEHDRDHRRQPPAAGPTEAPPPPHAETATARAGFVWVPGRWDWRGKWEWIAGHEERERAGKKWREGRWDHQGDRWVFSEGAWDDAGAARPPGDAPHEAPPPPRAWPAGRTRASA